MIKSRKLTLVVLIILLLISTSLALFVIDRTSLTGKGEYRVVPAYEGQANYIAGVRADPTTDKDALYRQYVTDVYPETCGGGGLISTNYMSSLVAEHPLGNLDEFAEEIRILRDSDTTQIAEKALQHAWEALPGSKVAVCIFALDPIQRNTVILRMNGIYGVTTGPDQIWIVVAPQEGWQNWLPYAIAHEYHHAVFFQDDLPEPRNPPDLLELMTTEGRADSFARMLYPDLEAPWTKALTPEQEATQWQLIQNELTSTENLARFLFGDNQTPWWTGYTIGFHIVQKYIESHPDVSLKEWTQMDAHEILAESGYVGQP